MQPPAHEQLVADLKALRERGLTRLRDTRLKALDTAAVLCGHVDTAAAAEGSAQAQPQDLTAVNQYRPAAVEELLRRAVTELGGGNLTTAAEYTFGLVAGTRDWPVGERRKKAAAIYSVSTERFRKHHEQLIVNQAAEAILRLCIRTRAPQDASSQRPGGTEIDQAVHIPRGPRVLLLRGAHRPVTLDFMPVELINGIDIIVSSENIYLETSKIFRNSLSAALRRACAEITEAGQLVDDVIQRELTQWMRAHGRLGLPVAPGTVAVTDPGRLRQRGVRRIYHAAVATPRADVDEYEFSPEAVARAVRNVFRLAEEERTCFQPPLRSIALPLFGAGHGGLEPAESLGWLWAAVEREFDHGQPDRWDLHLVTHRQRDVEAIVQHFEQH